MGTPSLREVFRPSPESGITDRGGRTEEGEKKRRERGMEKRETRKK